MSLRDHIATSLSIDPDDFGLSPFAQRGGLAPNDNPFIESAFSTAKRAPEYPGQFRDDAQAATYFEGYFDWYNREHYHSAIDYVTPQQAHEGLRGKIVKQRLSQHRAQRLRRRTENQQQKTTNEKARKPNPATATLVA